MLVVTWKVDDGYVNNGPHQTHIDDADLEECEDDAERERLIEEAVQTDFENNVSWYIVSRDQQ